MMEFGGYSLKEIGDAGDLTGVATLLSNTAHTYE